jgi:hypothetical protein
MNYSKVLPWPSPSSWLPQIRNRNDMNIFSLTSQPSMTNSRNLYDKEQTIWAKEINMGCCSTFLIHKGVILLLPLITHRKQNSTKTGLLASRVTQIQRGSWISARSRQHRSILARTGRSQPRSKLKRDNPNFQIWVFSWWCVIFLIKSCLSGGDSNSRGGGDDLGMSPSRSTDLGSRN